MVWWDGWGVAGSVWSETARGGGGAEVWCGGDRLIDGRVRVSDWFDKRMDFFGEDFAVAETACTAVWTGVEIGTCS